MSAQPDRPRAICILGMHRSGTSAVTRAVSALGAYLGAPEQLLPAAPDNPEGFWERRDVCSLSSRLLEALRTTWDSVAPLPGGWTAAAAVAPLRDELVVLVREAFAGHPLWAWKDPRTCLLLPLWKEVLRERGVDLAVICTLRNPLDVARSLHRRDGLPLGRGFGIWFNYTLSSLQALGDLPAAFVAYDRFLEDPPRELRRCAGTLGLSWPAGDAALETALAALVRPDLRHSVSGLEELLGAGAVPPVIDLYGLSCRLAGGAALADAAVAAGLARLSGEHAAYAALFRDELLDAGLARLAQRETGARLRECSARLAETEHQALLRGERLAWMERSWSWRATAPLRRLARLLRGR